MKKGKIAILTVTLFFLTLILMSSINLTPAYAAPTYYGENNISFLPSWKNDTFYEGDTVTIKVGVVYNMQLRRSYHIKINITRPDSSVIMIDDYVREYDDPNYYVEVPIQAGENGSWMVETYAEYKTTVLLIFTVTRWNDGTKNFTVLPTSSIPPGPETIQISPDNTYFASPNTITIDELGSSSTTLAARVRNLTHNKPNMFTRFYIKDKNNQTVWTDSGYTGEDGKITKTVPANTFFVEGDYLVEIYVSKSGIELMNATGVLRVRYIASPYLYPDFVNQYGENKSYFNETDDIWVNWSWSLYKGQPDTVICKVKFISSDSQTTITKNLELTILYDGQNFLTKLLDASVVKTMGRDNYTVVLETLSLDIHNYEMILGVVGINSTIYPPPPPPDFITPLLVGIFVGTGIVGSVIVGALVYGRYRKTIVTQKRKTTTSKKGKGFPKIVQEQVKRIFSKKKKTAKFNL